MNSCDPCGPVRAPAAWAEALSLMQRALALLDQTCCPSEVGAHLDLAANRLELTMLLFVAGEFDVPALVVELL